jgi:hypothetical protein
MSANEASGSSKETKQSQSLGDKYKKWDQIAKVCSFVKGFFKGLFGLN